MPLPLLPAMLVRRALPSPMRDGPRTETAAQIAQTTYNVTSMSFTPAELAASIQKFIPTFRINYIPDYRNDIAQTWPSSIDDRPAREDWGWQPKFDIDGMTKSMLDDIHNQMVAAANKETLRRATASFAS